MIRYRVDIQAGVLDGLEAWLETNQDIAHEISQRLVSTYGSKFRYELATYPGPVKYPIQWKSEKQRKAFFATDGFGSGIPYRRTGHLGRSWDIAVSRTSSGDSRIEIDNRATYAKFVIGTLSSNPQRYQLPIQPFHRNTGWQPASPTVQFWVEALREQFITDYKNAVGSIGTDPTFKRYAITPRMR